MQNRECIKLNVFPFHPVYEVSLLSKGTGLENTLSSEIFIFAYHFFRVILSYTPLRSTFQAWNHPPITLHGRALNNSATIFIHLTYKLKVQCAVFFSFQVNLVFTCCYLLLLLSNSVIWYVTGRRFRCNWHTFVWWLMIKARTCVQFSYLIATHLICTVRVAMSGRSWAKRCRMSRFSGR